jgi:hypothetical protein
MSDSNNAKDGVRSHQPHRVGTYDVTHRDAEDDAAALQKALSTLREQGWARLPAAAQICIVEPK